MEIVQGVKIIPSPEEDYSTVQVATFDELMTAYADIKTLPRWMHLHDINSDIVVPADSTCKCQANGVDNRGSPLLIAVELDLPAVCAELISNGADVNYRHPSEHGNCPLLRAAEMGLTECLAILLDQPSLNYHVVTKEYKLVLGQNIPQYEAGGRSALLLAVESLQPTAVALLLSKPSIKNHLLNMPDSFGRSPLHAAWEVYFLREEGTEAKKLAQEIVLLICNAMGKDYSTALAEQSSLGMDKAEAKDRLRRRNVELRSRFLTASHQRRLDERAKGMAQWTAQYWLAGKALHPEVYKDTFSANDLIFPSQFNVSSIAVSEGNCIVDTCVNSCSKTLLSPQSSVATNAHFLPASECTSLIYEPLPGTFVFPLLQPSVCSAIYAELEHYENVARHHPELSLPLHIRHDGNLGQLESCGFEPLLKAIEKIWQPLVRELMPTKGDCEVYHAFLTRNWVDRDENATFKRHCDKSDLTFNICLHASEGFEGSTVGFFRDPDGVGSAGRTPTEEERIYTHTHRVGYAVMHDGSQWHVTDPITKGTRASLIVWARRVGVPCVQCGAAMGGTWLFCKQCGKEVSGR